MSLFDVTLGSKTETLVKVFKLCMNPTAQKRINVEQMTLVYIFAQAGLIQ